MRKQDIEKEDIEHIREAKRRIVFTMVWFGLAFLVSYFYSNDLLEFITAKGKSAGYEFVYISPTEVLMAQLKITALAALVLTFPIIIFNLAAFIGPALEKGAISIILPAIFAVFMFGLGIAFSYLVLMPFVFNTLLDIGVTTDITAQVSVDNYISLYLTLLVSLGVVFELPILSLILTKAGVLKTEIMKKGRKLAIIIALLLSALITPPDVFSQIIVTIPILILYEISIRLCRGVEKKREKEELIQCV